MAKYPLVEIASLRALSVGPIWRFVDQVSNPDEINAKSLGEALKSEGFVIVPDVLTQSEVAMLRDQVNEALNTDGIHKAGGTVLPNAAAEAPSLGWIFSHPGILSAVRRATGLSEMVFTMEADLHRNYLASKWHKDTGEQMMNGGYFDCDPFESPDCRVFKVALYLQDHSAGAGSLHVRPGSITTASFDFGEDYRIPAKAGDMVLFDVRITHRGVRPSLVDRVMLGCARIFLKHSADSAAASWRRARLRLVGKPDRIAVYFAFGSPNDHSVRFAQRNMRRQLSQLGKPAIPLPSQLQSSFELANVQTVAL
jgi:hypothetical protein